MKEIDRRDFMKTVAIGGAVLAAGDSLLHKPLEAARRLGRLRWCGWVIPLSASRAPQAR